MGIVCLSFRSLDCQALNPYNAVHYVVAFQSPFSAMQLHQVSTTFNPTSRYPDIIPSQTYAVGGQAV